MNEFLIAILFIVFIIVLIGAGPILTIMSMNAVFHLGIAYSFSTWLGMCWLQFITFGGLVSAIKSLKK